MSRAAIWLIAWGCWLGILTAVQALFAPKLIQFAIPGVASAASVTAGIALWVSARRSEDEGARLLTDSSVATVTLVCGLALAMLGAAFGLWLILIGAGVGATGLGGVVREQRARAGETRRRSVR